MCSQAALISQTAKRSIAGGHPLAWLGRGEAVRLPVLKGKQLDAGPRKLYPHKPGNGVLQAMVCWEACASRCVLCWFWYITCSRLSSVNCGLNLKVVFHVKSWSPTPVFHRAKSWKALWVDVFCGCATETLTATGSGQSFCFLVLRSCRRLSGHSSYAIVLEHMKHQKSFRTVAGLRWAKNKCSRTFRKRDKTGISLSEDIHCWVQNKALSKISHSHWHAVFKAGVKPTKALLIFLVQHVLEFCESFPLIELGALQPDAFLCISGVAQPLHPSQLGCNIVFSW